MIPGLMQDVPLLTTNILDHVEVAHPRVEIVSRTVEGRIHPATVCALLAGQPASQGATP